MSKEPTFRDGSSFVLKVNGKAYSGWKEVHVEKSVEALCGVFGVSLADTSPLAKPGTPISEIHMGDRVQAYISDQLVLSGYVEDINLQYDEPHSIQISGRDKLGDLVDCHRPIALGNEMRGGRSVRSIVETFCRPFGITVAVSDSAASDASNIEPFWVINEGETVYESIRKLCQKNYLLPITMGDGVLLLTKEGSTKAVDGIQTGYNVLRASLQSSDKERFSDYYCKGYQFTFNAADQTAPTPIQGQAQDPQMRALRYRPLIVMADSSISPEFCVKRARAEVQFRAGRSRSLEYVVQGWMQSDGSIWQLNSSIQVNDEVFGLTEDTWMIDQVKFNLTPTEGTTTTLTLCKAEKYKAQADITRIKLLFDFLLISSQAVPTVPAT